MWAVTVCGAPKAWAMQFVEELCHLSCVPLSHLWYTTRQSGGAVTLAKLLRPSKSPRVPLRRHSHQIPYPAPLQSHPGVGTFRAVIRPKLTMSEVGGENGAKRSPPTGNPSPAPTHPHRTHDTTDQWREIVQWLGRFERIFLLCA